jgi:post-segregation antitoxin (ccd killing protein)
MPKISVYLPDDLYQMAREEQLPLSTLAQRAIEQALRAGRVERWVERVRARPARVTTQIGTLGALDQAREEFGG